MKIKPIKNMKDIKAGYYLRFGVSSIGQGRLLTVYKVCGKPFKYVNKRDSYLNGRWIIKANRIAYNGKLFTIKDDSTVSIEDLMSVSCNHFMFLIPFRSKTASYLRNLSDVELMKLCEQLRGRKLPEPHELPKISTPVFISYPGVAALNNPVGVYDYDAV